MKPITISIVDTDEGMLSLRLQWNRLLSESVSNTLFLSWEWMRAWIEQFMHGDRRLLIMTLHEGEKMVGIAPFYTQVKKQGIFRLKEIKLLGMPEAGSDYLDVFAQKGRERHVAEALYAYLMENEKHGWDVLTLQNIRANSLFLLHFSNCMDEHGKYYEIDKGAYCPFARIPETEADFYSGLSKGRRKKFKRDTRVVHREASVVHSMTNYREGPQRLEDFFRLYQEKTPWNGKPMKHLITRFAELCEDPETVRIDLLSIDRKDVAGLLHLKNDRFLLLLLMAVDKSYNPKISLGNVLVGFCIKHAIDERYDVYDFLKGDEDYKFHWATGGTACLSMRVWKKSPMTLFYVLSENLKNVAKLMLR